MELPLRPLTRTLEFTFHHQRPAGPHKVGEWPRHFVQRTIRPTPRNQGSNPYIPQRGAQKKPSVRIPGFRAARGSGRLSENSHCGFEPDRERL